jgi:aryl-alcohol dehydrogenase-like predicted oxidoreductase
MRYKLLGRSGLRVSELSLGTMTFGEEWGWGASKEESKKMFDAFAEAGGNFIDTANRYTDGTSERYVGEFIASERERFVVATKYTLYTRKGDPNSAGNHRKNMVQSLEASLRRLKTPYIDLYWVHAWDFLTPEEEVLRALDDMVRQGKILYIGISNTPAWIVSRMNTLADLRGWTSFTALQIEYSLIQRTVEREYLPMARALDLAVAAWAPLGGGALTGKYLEAGKEAERGRLKEGSARRNERNRAIAQEVVNVAREAGCSPAHVALRWLLARNGVVIPIVGARRLEQLEDCLASTGVSVNPEYLKRLDEASAIEPGYPHDFLASPPIREIVYGGIRENIEAHR